MEIYQVTMKNKDKDSTLECVIIRTRNTSIAESVIAAESIARPLGTFYVHSIIAGPKYDLSE